MKRPWQIWTLFLIALAVVLPAMVFLTLKAVELDAANEESRRQTEIARQKESVARQQAELARKEAELQELVSTALWRMDWMLTPLVAQEAARPYYVYESFYPVASTSAEEPSGGKSTIGKPTGKTPVQTAPSPLLMQPSEFVLLHFQLSPENAWSSPQNPEGMQCEVALSNGIDPANIKSSAILLAELQKDIQRDQLLALLPEELLPAFEPPQGPWANNLSINYSGEPLNSENLPQFQNLDLAQLNAGAAQFENPSDEANNPPNQPSNRRGGSRNSRDLESRQSELADDPNGEDAANPGGRVAVPNQFLRSQNDFQQRSQAAQSYAYGQRVQQGVNTVLIESPTTRLVREGVSRPLWVGEKLLMARRVVRDESVLIQGCWLDWGKLQRVLTDEVTDLLPDVRLARVLPEEEVQAGRALATLPVQLVVPEPTMTLASLDHAEALSDARPVSAIRVSLIIAWVCLLMATVAVAIVLQGVMKLSERRGAFVSAVTHELRTPLTTFRMYAEMLAEGMVENEESRKQYTETLRIEADRLSHLVENVLQYARLERGNPSGRREEVSIGTLLDRVAMRLADRATQAEMRLNVEADAAARDVRTSTDPAAVEQILFNLVDNACKYASAGEDKQIVLRITPSTRGVEISVRDYGPGISPKESKRMFMPFSKSADQAANSAPGVGLGLALCRRLASDLDGRLELQSPPGGGAKFVLLLPTV